MKPTGNVDVRATRLHERMNQVLPAIAAVVPEQGALDRCLLNLLNAEDPWADKQNLANLTEIVARLNFATGILSGFVGENDLVVDDAREFSLAAIERGLIPPVPTEVRAIADRETLRRRRWRASR